MNGIDFSELAAGLLALNWQSIVMMAVGGI